MGGVAVQSASVKELTESVHCREPFVFPGIINLRCLMLGKREDEMAGPVALLFFLESLLSLENLPALSLRRAVLL